MTESVNCATPELDKQEQVPNAELDMTWFMILGVY